VVVAAIATPFARSRAHEKRAGGCPAEVVDAALQAALNKRRNAIEVQSGRKRHVASLAIGAKCP